MVTSHNRPLSFDDGTGFQLYTPTSGFDSSASQAQSGLRESNRDILGVISDERFTYHHLRAGLWDGASVIVSEVDWMYPHAGAITRRTYEIARVVQTGESFTAELSGLTARLRAKSGRFHSRPCNADLFDTRCGIAASDDSDWETTGLFVKAGSQDSVSPRRIFDTGEAGFPGGIASDFYKYGKLVWTVGNNAVVGHVSIIKASTVASPDHTIEIYEDTPFDIDDNDQYTAFVGCDKLFETCRTKFVTVSLPAPEGNTINHRGKKWMPSSDHVLRSPASET